jgi:P4 family phage/plasmid primase-like protien
MQRVLVFSTKFAVGYPDPPNHTETTFPLLAEALTKSYDSDAHFVGYQTSIERRVRVEAIGVVPIAMHLLVGDVDDPIAHAANPKIPARPEWLADEREKIAKFREKHAGAYAYETNGGYRTMLRLEGPFVIGSIDDKRKWETLYLDFRDYLAREFMMSVDPKCKDFTRFFRLPYVVRKGKREIHPSYGDPENIATIRVTARPEPPKRPKPPKYVREALKLAEAEVLMAPLGSRNEALNRAAYSLGGFIPKHLDRDTVHETLLHAILSNGGDPENDAKKIEAAIDAGMAKPREIPKINGANGAAHVALYEPPTSPPTPPPTDASDDGETAQHTDVSNAERLVERHLNDLKYVSTWGKWIFWDGRRWEIDSNERALRFAVATARTLMKEAKDLMCAAADAQAEADASGDDLEKAKAKDRMRRAMNAKNWAVKSHSRQRLEAMLAVACADTRISIKHDQLDADGWRLNVGNGTIDLRTGALSPHRREDLVTKIAAVDYDAASTAPTWLAFLDAVMGGEAELVSYLSRAIGYALTGEIRDHVLVFFHGETGSNGKGTFVNTIHRMLGDYATPAARKLLFRGKNERHPTEFATLHGKRFVTCSEIEEGQSFDEGLVKDLTGGDIINARRMHENEWKFTPTHKLFISGNHKPRIRGTDGGIWRRIHLVPWLVCFEKAMDLTLPAKLEAELPGILAWAVRGCLEWQRAGLVPPGGVRDATRSYRDESNPLGEFIALRCKVDPEGRVSRRAMRDAYERYCRENGEKYPIGPRPFTAKLRSIGAEDTTMREATLTGQAVVDAWRGIRLLTPEELDVKGSVTENQALTN